jgi:hypothetical protein
MLMSKNGDPEIQSVESGLKPWYGQTWLVVLTLVFFFPAGLYLMWFHSRWRVGLKLVVTAVVVVGIVIAELWWVPHQLKCEREFQSGTISEDCRR